MSGERFWCNSSGVGLIIYYFVKTVIAESRNSMVLNKSRILAVLLMVTCTFHIGGELAEKLATCATAID